jgi:hypothetical protein
MHALAVPVKVDLVNNAWRYISGDTVDDDVFIVLPKF